MRISPVRSKKFEPSGMTSFNDKLEDLLFEMLAHAECAAQTLANLCDTAGMGAASAEREDFVLWLSILREQVSRGEAALSRDPVAAIDTRIAVIDHAVSRQMDEVLHHQNLQRLEATWRALWYLVSETETSSILRIRVLNVTKRELTRDLERSPEIDQSAVFKKVYEREYGRRGGCPFALLVADYYFDHDMPDASLLESMAALAAAAHAPFIAGVSPQMFDLRSFTELASPRDLFKIFDTESCRKWKAFRTNEFARYVGLALPRILLRLPYGRETVPVERFSYDERISDHEHYLWGNAAFALAARVTASFARFGECSAIRGVEGGGEVSGLPDHPSLNDYGELEGRGPALSGRNND